MLTYIGYLVVLAAGIGLCVLIPWLAWRNDDD